MFTWDILDIPYLEDKNKITQNLGMWDTLDMEFVRSDGASGISKDFHWSSSMNEKFYTYIKEKFNLI